MLKLIVVSMALFVMVQIVSGSDEDPLQDFCVADPSLRFGNGYACKAASHVSARDFKSNILGAPANNATSNPLGIAATLASPTNVAGLNTQGLSLVRIDYAPSGIVPPHLHPRASEVLYVLHGTLHVGFIDTSGKLFSEVLGVGEFFVFPRGLVHYIYNAGTSSTASSISALNSQNPGSSFIPNALFGSQPSIPDPFLEKAFHLSLTQVHHLKKSFGA